jgi:Flp pilus assembly secretin CpaC
MSLRTACIRARHGLARRLGAGVAAAAVFLASAASGAETISVFLDRATVLKMPEKVATVIVGNPLIADVSLQPGGIMVLTGKGFGATNMLALDRSGAVLMEKSLQVLAPSENVLVVYRGAMQESYSCNPNCERRITLGDAKDHFDAALGQTKSRNDSAQSRQ